MGLEDLNERIYKRDYEGGTPQETEFDPGNTEVSPGEEISFRSDEWTKESEAVANRTFRERVEDFFATKWKWVVIGVASVAFIALLANLAFLRAMLFSNDRVSVAISGPKEVASAETVEYTVEYGNRNLLAVRDAEITLSFPGSFRIESGEGISISGNSATISIGAIGSNTTGRVKFSGKFYGSKGTFAYLKAVLRYAPSGVSIRYETETQSGVTIASSPLSLEISAPQEVSSGGEAEYVVSYRNDGDLSFSNLRIRTEYPSGFRFNRSDPSASEGDSTWRIGNLLPRGSGEIRIKGILTGNRDEAKVFRVSLGVLQGDGTFISYDQKERVTRIVASPLVITQTVNGKSDISVNPGDALKYELRYVNQGGIGLRDVIVTLEVNADFLDLTKLQLTGGAYDSARRLIVWKAPDFPGLARLEPGQGGTIDFSVPVRSDIGTSGEAGKNLAVRTVAKIDSPDVPFSSGSNKVISSNVLEVKIGAIVDFQALGYYFDTTLPNSGPIPPKVGTETTYTIRLKVTNFLNDLSHAKVTATLPTGVRYTGKRSPESESTTYNERTGQFVWNIGSLFGGGKSTRELAFQVAATPSPNEAGKPISLLLGSVFEAQDVFTGQQMKVERGAKTSAIAEDASVSDEGYNVVP